VISKGKLFGMILGGMVGLLFENEIKTKSPTKK